MGYFLLLVYKVYMPNMTLSSLLRKISFFYKKIANVWYYVICFVTNLTLIPFHGLLKIRHVLPKNALHDENRAQLLHSFQKLFLAITMRTSFTTHDMWLNRKVCSVCSGLSQSSIRRVLSKNYSSTLSILESRE